VAQLREPFDVLRGEKRSCIAADVVQLTGIDPVSEKDDSLVGYRRSAGDDLESQPAVETIDLEVTVQGVNTPVPALLG